MVKLPPQRILVGTTALRRKVVTNVDEFVSTTFQRLVKVLKFVTNPWNVDVLQKERQLMAVLKSDKLPQNFH